MNGYIFYSEQSNNEIQICDIKAPYKKCIVEMFDLTRS